MSKNKKIYCVQWDTTPYGIANVTVHACVDAGHEPARCSGRGHTAPGHFAHVKTTSPARALMEALGWSRRRAKEYLRWLEEEEEAA